jgi:hypothetical protein
MSLTIEAIKPRDIIFVLMEHCGAPSFANDPILIMVGLSNAAKQLPELRNTGLVVDGSREGKPRVFPEAFREVEAAMTPERWAPRYLVPTRGVRLVARALLQFVDEKEIQRLRAAAQAFERVCGTSATEPGRGRLSNEIYQQETNKLNGRG